MRNPPAGPEDGHPENPPAAGPPAYDPAVDGAELSAAEQALWAAYPRGELVDLRPEAPGPLDPAAATDEDNSAYEVLPPGGRAPLDLSRLDGGGHTKGPGHVDGA